MSDLRFEILGPLRILGEGQEIALGSTQQRTVLAVLLLHANRPLSRQELIDAVWGEAAPAYALNLAQKHISTLRRLLEPGRSPHAPSRLLTWTDHGYLLNLPPGSLDLWEFEQAVRQAKTAADPDDAAALLAGAAGLWRGPLCDGLITPLLDAERYRLEELRLDAAEERVRIDLSRGRHHELVPELRALVTAHPLRERLHAQLMLALYHSGRQAEALAAFHRARNLLLTELGVEPGPHLRQAQAQILQAPAAPVPTGFPAPAQLPYGLPHFAGREAELERLDALCRGGNAVLITAIGGMAGVGKTSLAVHWAHRVRRRFPDGQLYVNLRGFDPSEPAMEPAEAIRGFLDAFGVPSRQLPISLPAQTALYRSLVADRRLLIILDNAADAEQVRPLLPGSPGCLVLVTSRDQLSGLIAAEGAQPLPLDLLSPEDAWRLLAQRLGEQRVAAEAAAVEEIIALCGRLPLALAIVAARAATRPHFPMSRLARELRGSGDVLDALHSADRSTDIRSVFSWSLLRLPAAAQRMFRLIGLHPGTEFSLHSAAALAAGTVRETRARLTELADAQLVMEGQTGRFRCHDLLRAYALDLTMKHEAKAERRAAVQRVLGHYLQTAFAAERLINPFRDPPDMPPPDPCVIPVPLASADEAMTWFAAEHAALLAAVDNASVHRFDGLCWRLAWAISTYLDRQAHWHDLAGTGGTALAAAGRIDDLTGRAQSHRGIARAHARQNRHDEARHHLHSALALFDELGDQIGQAYAHRNIAAMLDAQNRDHEALKHAARALELYRASGHKAGLADALNAVGWFECRVGEHRRGLDHCREALALHEELHDLGGQAQTWDSLGYAHHHLGDIATALTCYERAISQFRALGDRYNEAVAYSRMGDAHQAGGDDHGARAAWRRSLAIFAEIGHSEAGRLQARLVTPGIRGPQSRSRSG
ncbi:AfsR/SARP family transcriptional regulator [Nonomuraea typhae]|uniref:AfsR/SARP family transcriptional regulator n=1 Tax=Nonomuraea typhae TaxID=2603600 RepID=A0ABW7YSY1_9ACTN